MAKKKPREEWEDHILSEADDETMIRGFHWARGDAGVTQEEYVHAINQVRAMKHDGLKAGWIVRGMLLVKDIGPAGDLIC
jgi:hypothetical protein